MNHFNNGQLQWVVAIPLQLQFHPPKDLTSSPATTHSDDGGGPASALGRQLQGQGHVDNDLLVSGLVALLDNVQVLAAHITDVAGHVQEAEGGDLRMEGETCVRLGWLGALV